MSLFAVYSDGLTPAAALVLPMTATADESSIVAQLVVHLVQLSLTAYGAVMAEVAMTFCLASIVMNGIWSKQLLLP